MLTKLKSVVSEASVLPPPPPTQSNEPQGLPQPISSQSSSRESLAQRSTVQQPSSSKQPPQEPTIGYQGTPPSQKTVEDTMGDFPDVRVKNNGPTGTPLLKQAIQNPNKRTFTKQSAYLSPMQNNKGSLVTKDDNNITRMAIRKEYVPTQR